MTIIFGRFYNTLSLSGKDVILRGVLNYRRMPDSYAKYLGIDPRPSLEVGRDEVRFLVKN